MADLKVCFNDLFSHYTKENLEKYTECVNSLTESNNLPYLIQNSESLYAVPSIGLETFERILESNSIPTDLIEREHKKLSKFIGNLNPVLKSTPYEGRLISCLDKITEQCEAIDTDLYIAQETATAFQNTKQVVLEAVTESASADLINQKSLLELDFATECATLFMNPDTEVNTQDIQRLVNIAGKYQNVLEAMGLDIVEEKETFREKFNRKRREAKKVTQKGVNSAKDNAVKMKDKAAPVTNKAKDATVKGAKKGANLIKKIPTALQALIDNTYGRLKKMDKAQRRKAMLEGGMYKKLTVLIRTGLKLGVFALGPILGSIGLLGLLVHDQKVNSKVRLQIVEDMQQELKITKEKIRDADASGDKNAKYQLMRIEDALQRDITRVKLDSDSYRATTKNEVKY